MALSLIGGYPPDAILGRTDFFIPFHRLAIRVKAALTQSLLEKTLKIRFVSDSATKEGKENGMKKDGGPEKSKVGMINNLMSTDLDQLAEARYDFI